MNPTTNFQEIYNRLTALLCKGPQRITVVSFGEFGSVSVQHITLESAALTKYDQYPNALKLSFKKRGGRALYTWMLSEDKTFSIFKGWATTSCKQPGTSHALKNRYFYSAVDAMEGWKIGEHSERIYLTDRLSKPKLYKVITNRPEGRKTEIFQDISTLTAVYPQAGTLRDNVRRAELQGSPYLKNLCGPMYDGEENGCAVIRYESQAVYNVLSN